jgi:hypothetical protein
MYGHSVTNGDIMTAALIEKMHMNYQLEHFLAGTEKILSKLMKTKSL